MKILHPKPVAKSILKFDKKRNLQDDDIRGDLSTVVSTEDFLWLAFDESAGVERLQKDGDDFCKHKHFLLSKYIDLPSDKLGEVDIEGLAYDGHYLWVAGSHSLKRDKPDDASKKLKKRVKSLSKVKNDPNRYTIARIPLTKNTKSGKYKLHKACSHPDKKGKKLKAAKLKSGKKKSQLSKVLKKDKHLKKFMTIPSKDNGFDIEGIAVIKNRVFLGLRGPVLRGWAVIVEIALKEKKGKLKLKKIGRHKQKYRKHFVDLCGMGIRELAVEGKNLLILAGPTMDCDGIMTLYRLNCGPDNQKESLIEHEQLDKLFDVSLSHKHKYGKEKAEGVTVLNDKNLIVVYDEPGESRQVGKNNVKADIFKYKNK